MVNKDIIDGVLFVNTVLVFGHSLVNKDGARYREPRTCVLVFGHSLVNKDTARRYWPPRSVLVFGHSLVNKDKYAPVKELYEF